MDDPLSQAWLELADGRMHWLDKNTCTIGRGATSNLVLDVPGISRSHAMLQPGPAGGYLLVWTFFSLTHLLTINAISDARVAICGQYIDVNYSRPVNWQNCKNNAVPPYFEFGH